MSDTDLKEKEAAASAPADQPQARDELKQEPEQSSTAKFIGRARNAAKSRKGLAIAGGGGGILIIIVIILIFFLISLGKAVHFSTVLRSTGFAGSQAIMRDVFMESAYARWADVNDTAQLPKSKLLDRLRGQDMRKIQRQLGDSGEFKYTVDSAGKVTGFEVQGERVAFDDLAKKLGKDSFNDLSFREKLATRKYVSDTVKFKLNDTFDMETRSFRNGFWKGFREATGIKMTRFRDIFRDRFGDGTVVERLNNDSTRLSTEVAEVHGSSSGVGSSIPEVEEAADEIPKTIEENAKKGIRVRSSEALDTYLQSKGSNLIEFQEGMGKVSTAVMVLTLYCIGHDLSQTSDRLNQQMEMTLANYGHQQQTTADQIKSGDVTSGDVAFANKEWSGDKDTPDAAASPLYKAAIGQPTTGDVSQAPRMNISLPLLDWLKPIDSIVKDAATLGLSRLDPTGTVDHVTDSVINHGCSVVMNPYAQGAVLVADIAVSVVTLGSKDLILKSLQGVAVFAGFAGLGHLIENYIKSAAGTGISGTETGADKYNAAAVSTDYLNSQSSRGVTYGRPESNDEAASTKAVAMNELRDYYNEGSFSERYLAMDNPMSLAGRIAAVTPTTFSGLSTFIPSLLGKMVATISHPLKLFSSLTTNKALAAEEDFSKKNGYFGVNQWGWTNAEREQLNNIDMFSNAAEVEADMERDPHYYDVLQQCYNSNRMLYQLQDDENCSASNLGTSRALKWRIYKVQLFAATQISSEGLNEN